MQIALLLAALLVVSSAIYDPTTCTYSLENGNQISLKSWGGWINATDGTSTWLINPCPNYEYPIGFDSNPCSELEPVDGAEATVCVSVNNNGEYSVRGWNTTAQVNQFASVLEVLYPSNETCDENSNYKTELVFVCADELDSAEVSTDGCLNKITIISNDFCNWVIPEETGVFEEDDQDEFSGLFFTMVISFVGFVLSMCCCCCCFGRRKCRQRKLLQQQQFSSVAFQPIPPTNASQNAVPNYNPYLTQPQYYFYYPNQIAQVPLDHVEKSDAQLAQELQAQYDREAAQL